MQHFRRRRGVAELPGGAGAGVRAGQRVAPRQRFVVVQPDVRQEVVVAGLRYAEAEVNVVELHRERFIEAVDSVEDLAPHHEAGSSHRQ